MLDNKNIIPIYHAFGLNIQCELAFASLFGMAKSTSTNPDIIIKVSDVPYELENVEYKDHFISATPGCILLKIKGIARYLICNGAEITIQIEPGANEGDVATFVFGSALGTLLYQRSILALHGSAVRTSKGAVIFSGPKGTGKSTTAAALSMRGWEFISDDVCAVHINNDNTMLYPGLSRAKLALDSYSSILTHNPDEPPVSPILKKYGVSFVATPKASPLYAICILETTSGNPYIENISGTERLSTLISAVYRPLIHQLILNPIQRFRQYSLVSSQATFLRVFRPLDYSKMDMFMKLLEENVLI